MVPSDYSINPSVQSVKKVTYLQNGGGVNLPPKDFCSYWPNGSTDFHAVWSIRRRNLSGTGCMQTGSSNSYHLPTWRRKPEVVWFSSLYVAFSDVCATTCVIQHSFHFCWPAWDLTTTAQHQTRNVRPPELKMADYITRKWKWLLNGKSWRSGSSG